MKKKLLAGLATGLFLTGMTSMASATAVSITSASDNLIGIPGTLPFTLTADNNNDGVLYLWDEVQNFTLTENLLVDRVADTSASYVGGTLGNYYIAAGTVVSSHYVQWDPAVISTVMATLNFDSDIFAFITADNKLANSDYLGLSGLNYGDFTNRGLESGDLTIFNGGSVDINWSAASPGDWTRLITAFSPTVNQPVPEPSTILLIGTGIAGLLGTRKRRKIN